MKPFDVYPLFDIEPVEGEGAYLYSKSGAKYLDLYGGHAVISIGHSHPHYVKTLTEQLNRIGFYSNSVQVPQQNVLAEKLGKISGYPDYSLFLCNSGAEANENALKLASFQNGRSKVIAFRGSFHGRTSAAVAATDDPKISAPINRSDVTFLPLNDEEAFLAAVSEEICAVIIEGIQGVGGVRVPDNSFLRLLRKKCTETGAILILDEVQSGYGRSGKFFAHQYAGIKPDLITVAKGMGNGFPVAGVLISPAFIPKHGQLGTTFGGNYLACAAAIAVLEVIEKEGLVENADILGVHLANSLRMLPSVKEVRGRGLMIGVELDRPCADVRKQLLDQYRIFTGSSSDKNTLRILPPLNIGKYDLDTFVEAFSAIFSNPVAA